MLTIVVCPSSAFAHFLGGSWDTPSGITYCFNSIASSLVTPTHNAVNAWNNTDTAVYFHYEPSGGDVDVQSYDWGDCGWAGRGYPGPDMDSGTYTYGVVDLNEYWTSTFGSTKNKALIGHELGHILGLAHCGTSTHALLHNDLTVFYDQWGISTPQQHDVNDINTLY
jgi:hypothetical protein